ncbi:unnamed protein product [Prorocentrum cordatum]|uniref:Uncharacterized protein n=1 Tax=Prorocentrum cordatum TaxID=2364126 RepID=A0ABN9WTQ7_9DINO|nr:unnamed protein product [Polarella glacialis]
MEVPPEVILSVTQHDGRASSATAALALAAAEAAAGGDLELFDVLGDHKGPGGLISTVIEDATTMHLCANDSRSRKARPPAGGGGCNSGSTSRWYPRQACTPLERGHSKGAGRVSYQQRLSLGQSELWVVPVVEAWGLLGLAPQAFDFLIRVLDKVRFPSFVIPARQICMAPFRRYAWRSQPMPYVMEVSLLKQALQQIGADKGRIEQATFNTMRRFMPTACNILNLPSWPSRMPKAGKGRGYSYGQQECRILGALEILSPLQVALAECRSMTARAVAASRHAAALAFLAAVFRWPDRAQAEDYISGFCTVDRVDSFGISRWLSWLGAPAKISKRSPMAQRRVILGAALTLGAASEEGGLVISPKDMSRRQVLEDLAVPIQSHWAQPAQAAKTRGRSNWVSSNSHGRIGRLGVAVLKHIQCSLESPLASEQLDALSDSSQPVVQVIIQAAHVLWVRCRPAPRGAGAPCLGLRRRGWLAAESATRRVAGGLDALRQLGVTTDLSLSFIGVGKVGRTIQIDSTVLKIGGVLGVAEARVKDVSTDKVIAVGRHTLMFVGEDNSATTFSQSMNSVFDV